MAQPGAKIDICSKQECLNVDFHGEIIDVQLMRVLAS